MIDRELLERIDACRAGSEDRNELALEGAEARAICDRVQAIDRAVGAAMHDVPVPVGLSERLLAHLATAQVADAAEAQTPSPTADTTLAVSRRRWLRWGAGLAAIAASVAVVTTVIFWKSTSLTAQAVHEQILPFYQQEQPGTAYKLAALPPGYPFSRYVNMLPGTTWRPVQSFLHRPELAGVAYELTYGGAEATLYVIPTQVAGLPSSPPQKISAATGNLIRVAWQEGEVLYVLVVQGDARAYQAFVKRAGII